MSTDLNSIEQFLSNSSHLSYSEINSFKSYLQNESFIIGSASAINHLLQFLSIDSLALNTLTKDEISKVKVAQMISNHLLDRVIQRNQPIEP